ncbi:DUF2341 domain-containing protein [Planctomycetota bacterium]
MQRQIRHYVKVLSFLTCLVCFSTLAEAAWYGTPGWKYRKKITINAALVPDTDATDLSNFPVLINTIDLDWRHTAQGGQVGNADGTDILFTLADGTTKLSHEIDNYNSGSGEVICWVKIPTLGSGGDTVIYIYYGKAGVADQQDTANVWAGTYNAVLHLQDDYNDSVDGDTPSNAPGAALVAAKIGKGADVDVDGDEIDYVTADALGATVTSGTVEFWLNGREATYDYCIDLGYTSGIIICNFDGAGASYLQTYWGGWMGGPAGVVGRDEWHHVVVRYDSASGFNMWVDGASYNTFNGAKGVVISKVTVGNYSGHGTYESNAVVDEVRFAGGVLVPDDWITTEFNNQNSPATFYSVGAEQPEALAWYHDDWHCRKKITINAAKVSPVNAGNLSAFPVLINRTDADWRSKSNSGHVGQDDGGDILFTASDGVSKLDHEIESYLPASGKLVTWVQVPTLSASENTDIYIYYYNTAVADQQNASGVWDADYYGVWHLKEDPAVAGANDIKDSTAYGLHGTDAGAMDNADQIPGKIGGSLDFDGGDDLIEGPSSNMLTGDNLQTATLSAWVRHSNAGDTNYVASLKRSAVYSTLFSLDPGNTGAGNLGFLTRNFADTTHPWLNHDGGYNDGQWHHLVGVVDGLSRVLYVDGDERNSDNEGMQSVVGNTAIFTIGAFQSGSLHFLGAVDEVRFSRSARSADYIKTEHNNQNDPVTFYTVGVEETIMGTTIKGG